LAFERLQQLGNQKFTNLVGKVFSRLTVVEFAGRDHAGKIMWFCSCECGGERTTRADSLRSGGAKSCGCLNKEVIAQIGHANRTHGKFGQKIYTTWNSMIIRCTNPKMESYKYYGALGVTVCEAWFKFENFYADMGDVPPGKTLDRKDPYGNYEPGNCRWATRLEQAHNKRKKVA
jgi:hypothetical protein